MSLELRDEIMSELNYAVRLHVPWHFHEVDGSFGHRNDGSVEDWICRIIEVLVEVVRVDPCRFSCLDSALGPSFVLPSVCCFPSIVFILWRVRGQIILRDLIWSFIGIMLT